MTPPDKVTAPGEPITPAEGTALDEPITPADVTALDEPAALDEPTAPDDLTTPDVGTALDEPTPPGEMTTLREATSSRPLPGAAVVMRRALLIWGLGHLALGDRRGWLLLVLQVTGLAAIVTLGLALLEGSREVVVFLALVVYLVVWAGQAIDAQRRAVLLGAAPGGAIQILVLAPVAISALTLFWLVGGTAGSPAAVMQRYVSAWRSGHPEVAASLFIAPPDAATLRDGWKQQSVYLTSRLEAIQRSLGTASGIDPRAPFASLMFDVIDADGAPAGTGRAPTDRDQATIAVDIVRDVTVPGSFFGLFPTASQQTVQVERVGTVVLRAIPEDATAGIARGQVWRIASVELPTP